MTNDKMQRLFLILVASGLPLVAISYGVMPDLTLPFLYNIEPSDVGTRHVMRSIMGLYLGLATFWLIGAARPDLRRGALWSLVLFMGGVGAGRMLSLVLDGMPKPIMVVFIGIEVIFVAIGALLLRSRFPLAD